MLREVCLLLIDGISIAGSYHDHNQDSYSFSKIKNGYIVAVSDGLGSKKNSKIGSSYLCQSIIEVICNNEDSLLSIDAKELVRLIYEKWIKKLENYDITQCYATMLFLLIIENRLIAVRLGDGFISISADELVKVLFDCKENYFANETDCLTEDLNEDKFEVFEMEFSEFNGAILCSDGVGIGNMTEKEISSFTSEFIDGYNTMPQDEVSEDIKMWLANWTGSDDKTLAYIMSERRTADE